MLNGCLSMRQQQILPAMLLLGVATSIDALAVGISLAVLSISLVSAAVVIGVTTFGLSFAGWNVLISLSLFAISLQAAFAAKARP